MVQPEIKDKVSKIVSDIINSNSYNNIDEVIKKVKEVEKSLSVKEIMDIIKELEDANIIRLSKRTSYDYLIDLNVIWLAIGSVSIILSTIFLLPQTEPYSTIRLVIGAVFIFFIPGYALTNLLFPDKENKIEVIGLSIMLSLIVVMGIGLILNYTHLGIRLEPVVIILSIITIGISIIAGYKRYRGV